METICDLANVEIKNNVRHPKHLLKGLAGATGFADYTPKVTEPAVMDIPTTREALKREWENHTPIHTYLQTKKVDNK
jgi:hypothetical protein